VASFVDAEGEILRLIVIACLVGSFLVTGFTGGGEASTSGGHAAAATVPLKILRSHGAVAAVAAVRIHGRLFPFIVDTGSEKTLVNVALARQLLLKAVGKPIKVSGVGCSETAHKVRLSNWSIGGQRLPRITAISSTIAGIGVPAGLLGSDVLSHFGAIGIDFAHGVLTLGRAP
jgi:Aspartyl protease